MITKNEAREIRNAIRLGLNANEHWSCWIVNGVCGIDVMYEYSEFFGQAAKGRWEGLDLRIGLSSQEENLQRELMLELFAHTRGKL